MDRDLRKALAAERYSLRNRLQSVDVDARRASAWLDNLCSCWCIQHGVKPVVIANLRNGQWLVDPASFGTQTARFKSVDGHHGIWSYSLRRPNLCVLAYRPAHGSDMCCQSSLAPAPSWSSTARAAASAGRVRCRRRTALADRVDALSKTVPLFCATINVALGLAGPDDLRVPSCAVSPSERQAIVDRIPEFAQDLLVRGVATALLSEQASSYPLRDLAAGITKPLRPVFATSDDPCPPRPTDCLPVVCFSASQPPSDNGRSSTFAYIQVRRLSCAA